MTFGGVRPLILLLALAGCGDGGVIPIPANPSGCDTPQDPRWVCLAPAAGDRRQLAAAWGESDVAVIVGEAGLALVRLPGGRFLAEDTGTERALRAAAVTASGTVLAVGDGGAVVERRGGAWRDCSLETPGALRALAVTGDEAWAVGDGGAVLHRAGGFWERTPFPATADLTGLCLTAGEVFVCTREGELYRRSAEGWALDGTGSWGEARVRSLATLSDGRVVVLADSLHVWRDDAWSPQAAGLTLWQKYALQEADELRAAGGSLWMKSGGDVYLAATGDAIWPLAGIVYSGREFQVAPLPEGRALLAGEDGEIIWWDGTRRDYDPAGFSGGFRLSRLDDGTIVLLQGWQPLELMSAGLRPLSGFDEEAGNIVRSCDALLGSSLSDCYAFNEDWGLYHLRDGGLARAVEWDWSEYREAAWVPGQGVFLAGAEEVWRWEDAGLVLELAMPEAGVGTLHVAAGAAGDLLAWCWNGVWLRRDDAWICLRDPETAPTVEDIYLVRQLPGGEVIMSSGSLLYVWTPGAEEIWWTDIEFSAGCPLLDYQIMVGGALGLFAATERPSRVFRLDDDPVAGSWSLVAGPCGGVIYDLLILEDGSLLASMNDRLLLYRPDRF